MHQRLILALLLVLPPCGVSADGRSGAKPQDAGRSRRVALLACGMAYDWHVASPVSGAHEHFYCALIEARRRAGIWVRGATSQTETLRSLHGKYETLIVPQTRTCERTEGVPSIERPRRGLPCSVLAGAQAPTFGEPSLDVPFRCPALLLTLPIRRAGAS